MELERRCNESAVEYQRRLIEGKLENHILADVDYAELSEFVYGKPYSSDVARRMMYGSKKTLDLIEAEKQEAITDSDMIAGINSQRIELEKERKRLYDQRREYNKLIAVDGRAEHLYAALKASADNLGNTVGCIFDDFREYFKESYNPGEESGDNEAVVVFSDWHYGMKVNNEFNSYNVDICKERVKSVVKSAIQRIEMHKCKRLHVVVLGDLIHGAIHVGARVASEELVSDQLIQVSEILAQAILALSSSVEETDVYVTYGNHARTVQNKHDSIHRDNIERIVPWWLYWRLHEYQDITIVEENSSPEFILMNVCGHDICAAHGDLDSVKASPRLLSTLFHKRRGMNIEYILLGDKHHFEGFEELGVTAQICGSLCGSDDYANEKRLYSTPSQLLLIVNPEVGVDAEYKLRCEQ